jgi:hypothetical protein
MVEARQRPAYNNGGIVGSDVFYVEGDSNTSTAALRDAGDDEKGTQCLGV